MIDYLQVQRLALKNNVSPEIIEKDYYNHGVKRREAAYV